MTFDDLENMISLFFSIIGLLLCLFKYNNFTKRRYLHLIVFFILRFQSDYYWTVYQLIMHDAPKTFRYVANFGWDFGFVILLFMIMHYQSPEEKKFFHPIILLPILTNVPQMFLYLPYENLIVNVLEITVTTMIMSLCLKDVVYHVKNKKNGTGIPRLSILIFLYVITEYGMWTFSCFDWPSELLSPFFYLNILNSFIAIFFSRAAEKDNELQEAARQSEGSGASNPGLYSGRAFLCYFWRLHWGIFCRKKIC